MKNLALILIFNLLCCQHSYSQCQRKPLLEQFTSETCPADLATNTGLKMVTDSNQGRVAIIAWHTPIPYPSTNTLCPYRQNKTENDWRYKPGPAGYGYPSQNTLSSSISNGINSSPTSRIDGQHMWVFGASSDHTGNFKTTYLNNARAVTSPFCLLMQAGWNAQQTALVVSVTITATQNFTATGSLRYRLVMTEELHYNAAPGTNSEKDFYNVARASFPDLVSGTALNSVWLNGDTQSFVISCTTPSTVVNKAVLNMVGFIQDDGNRMVLQAEETGRLPLQNDASLVQVTTKAMQCDTMLLSTITLSNIGTNTISTFGVNVQVDNQAVSSTIHSVVIAPGGFIALQPPLVAVSPGAHTYSVNIGPVNGQPDPNTGGNSMVHRFNIFSPPTTLRLVEDFKAVTFPPPGWMIKNLLSATDSWRRSATLGGYGLDTGCVKYPFFSIGYPGQTDALYLPPFTLEQSTKHAVSFDVAYAQYTNNSNDKLTLEISDDCGVSWTTLSSKSGSLLATAIPSLTPFRPVASEWRTENIDLAAYTGKPNLILRFVSLSDYGNDLFLDNINLKSTTAVDELVTPNFMRLFPNPATDKVSIEFPQIGAENITIEISTVTGQIIYTHTGPLSANENKITVNTGSWPEGIYLVSALNSGYVFTGKIAVRR